MSKEMTICTFLGSILKNHVVFKDSAMKSFLCLCVCVYIRKFVFSVICCLLLFQIRGEKYHQFWKLVFFFKLVFQDEVTF